MLRPATPLSVIFFLAFVLLLLSTLSTPVIEQIPLGQYQGYNFGVLGYCKVDTDTCHGPIVGYTIDGLFSGTNVDADFSLPESARHSLSSILIVHPIATLLTLVCFVLAVAAHFHGPSHSPRYLLALLILTFPTLLVTLLAFLVDILLFVPHMAWGSWIVLAATILIIGSSIVTCAMRRTLVSRKARKKRIAENPDMNGSAYYDNLAQQRMMAESLPKADSPPPMSGSIPYSGSTAVDKNSYATYEVNRHDTRIGETGDDMIPLNPARDGSIRSASTNGRYNQNENMLPMDNGMPRRPSRDQYGNLIPPNGEVGMAAAPGLRHQNSQGSLGSNRSNGYSQRGRGYGQPPRGYGPPRGGYGPRGGFGPRGGRGGYGPPPPPGWRGRGGYGRPPPGMMGRGAPPRQGPPPGYGNDAYYSTPRGPPPRMHQQSMPPMNGQFVADPDLAIGQAIEMDERTGSAQRHDHEFGDGPYGLRDSDVDVAGMVNLQQEQGQRPPQQQHPLRQEDPKDSEPRSPTENYSSATYVPPRNQWNPMRDDRPHQAQVGLASHTLDTSSSLDPHSSTAQASSGVMPVSPVSASSVYDYPQSSHHRRNNSENYYEDVDPRFAQETPPPPLPVHHEYRAMDNNIQLNRESGIPTTLTPGPPAQHAGHRMPSPTPPDQPPQAIHLSPEAYALQADSSNSSSFLERHDHRIGAGSSDTPPGMLEPIPDGARSPGEVSEASHFTSISQRPVNPDWRPGAPEMPPGSAFGGTPAGRAQRRKEDVILNDNPDFSLPGFGPSGAVSRGQGRARGRSAAATTLVGGPMAPAAGLTPAGRYPTDV